MGWLSSLTNKDSSASDAILQALGKSQAVIEFEPNGTILTANSNFLNAMGYRLDEIRGKHHSIFVDSDYAASGEYQEFWAKLSRGEFFSGEFKRVDKAGKTVWIQATYNPVLNKHNQVEKVIKFATDVTQQKLENADFQGQIEAIGKSQAVIEFNMDGTIITANDNFCQAMGYSLNEIIGHHHSMFAVLEYAASAEYKAFWQRLNQGHFEQGEYKRLGKNGKEVWINASYNPIFDTDGKPFKVVKYATDVTSQKLQSADMAGQVEAIGKSQAVIEFNMDGTIITANTNFLNAMGYSLEEIQGQHHSMFAEPEYAASAEYREFWQSLNLGEFSTGEYKRVGKNGKEIWIQASYNPILDMEGRPFKVVKFASDITAEKVRNADFEGQIEAIGKSQAVIEFNLDGVILSANENFCNAMGYEASEIIGKHHSMFAEPDYAASKEYKEFWQNLGRGNFDTGEYKRLGKGGREIWIQASYNPILDMDGRAFKVVKYASDITKQKQDYANFSGQIEAIGKAQAVIEFNMDGTIITANENFCNAMGYSLDEIVGKHHSMFAEPEYAKSSDYADFWRNLNAGSYDAGEYKRLGKGGKEIWIQASYNPIMDLNGQPYKVVKYASDITAQKQQEAKAREAADLASALKVCQANVMMANNDLEIVFTNDEVIRTLSRRQDQLRTALPNFDVNNLIGTCVDDFHKDPSHQRKLLAGLDQPYKTQLNIAELNFNLTASPWYDINGEKIGIIVEWEDVTDEVARVKAERELADANARVKQALDNVATCAMVADENNNIIYLNDAVKEMLRIAEADLRKDLPHFNANDVIGKNVDIFHKNPAHQRTMLERLTSTYKTQIAVGGRTFALTANPILGDDNKRLGTVVEWLDRTAEVSIEKEVESVIAAAASGDLTIRLDEADKTGFFLTLSSGLNQIVTIAEGVITDTVQILDALAHGDLTKRIDTEYQGIYDKLKRDANATADKLTEVIGRIEDSANTVATGAEEIAQGNADLSQRTEEQASSLEETASSMEEMTATVRQNAENARSANRLSEEAAKKASSGGEIVGKAVASMAEINDSSKKISDIIGVIDEIAFQTNLLALNAAVEAARAGEQGRGFAVVAGEVRNLAQRSAAAAKEIKDLIRDSVTKVEDGTSLVNQSGDMLNEIVEAVKKVNATIADISVASEEQSSGIEQVNKAVTQMDEMTQQNAALVEEASAAGESMSEQARAMKQLLSFFRLSEGMNQQVMTPQISRPQPRALVSNGNGRMPMTTAPVASDDEEWEEF